MEKEMKYVTPEVEVLEVMMEMGFAGSDYTGTPDGDGPAIEV